MSFENCHKEFDKIWPEHSKSQNFHFNVLLLTKVYIYIVWAKKVQRSYLSWNWRGIQNLERNRLVVSKLADGIWQNLTWALKVSKTFILMSSFWAKYILFERKKYRGVISHQAEKGYKIWRAIDLSFQNCHQELDKIWPGQSKLSKILF